MYSDKVYSYLLCLVEEVESGISYTHVPSANNFKIAKLVVFLKGLDSERRFILRIFYNYVGQKIRYTDRTVQFLCFLNPKCPENQDSAK